MQFDENNLFSIIFDRNASSCHSFHTIMFFPRTSIITGPANYNCDVLNKDMNNYIMLGVISW